MSSQDFGGGKAVASQVPSRDQVQESVFTQARATSISTSAAEDMDLLSRSQPTARESEVLGSSLGSTDTVRRRPEASVTGYGMIFYLRIP
jgi:hypothetical protein